MSKLLKNTSLALGISLAVSLNAQAERWDMTVPQPENNYITENVSWFAQQLKEETDGKIDLRVHAGGSLFNGAETKRAVQRDQAQMGVHVLSSYQNEDPIFGIDSVPFLADSFEKSQALWEVTRPVLDKKLSDQNIKILYHIPWPPQGVFIDRELSSADDAQGVKFRAYNNATARFAELMGMTPALIEEAELSQAAATGMVQSLISSGDPVVNHQLWSYLPEFYDAKAWLVLSHVFMNKDRWDALDEDTRNKITALAAAAEARGAQSAMDLTDSLKETLASKGVSINQPNEALAADFQEIGKQMQEEWLETAGEEGRDLIEAYRATQ
ncbi:TRAP transporter solute receptor, unknown substrate 5 [Marinobacterium lacunae]|uniref:TRAP-type C4-dicarboxylate transport system, periplasmic component n=1 Tax=Marinobacterium lacunae TaxID=1232683 RepID=A0A081G016_9GAMM|nr:TRAP transporter substrate-binding protein [Marinobacterium lacunae]KEA64121.1 TRAP transporter solute receptor, unknown substrate 5 [Marinobacterium lacunae]MBR9885614.1 TRAP transporter substrate-binding protein [Oceanospirillales bacterium]